MTTNLERGLPVEQLKKFQKTTPEARLKWLEEAQEFVKQTTSQKQLEKWRKIQNKSGKIHLNKL